MDLLLPYCLFKCKRKCIFAFSYRKSDKSDIHRIEETDSSKKRRSSFVASFYSSTRLKSERSLRRSNSKSISYTDEEEGKTETEVQGSPHPVMKRPLDNENIPAEISKEESKTLPQSDKDEPKEK